MDITDRQPRAFFRDIQELASFKKGVAPFFDPGWHISGLAKRQTPLKKMRDHLFAAMYVKSLWNIALPCSGRVKLLVFVFHNVRVSFLDVLLERIRAERAAGSSKKARPARGQ